MQKWFENNFFDLSLMISENQLDWIRLDKYALLLGLPTENPFVEFNHKSIMNTTESDELLGGALEEEIFKPFKQPSVRSTAHSPLESTTNQLKGALGLNGNHMGSLLGGFTAQSPSLTSGSSLLNMLNEPKPIEPVKTVKPITPIKQTPAIDTNSQTVLNMLANMGINAREKPISPQANSPQDPIVTPTKKWKQLPDQQHYDLKSVEKSDLHHQQHSIEQQEQQKDWKGWAKVNQTATKLTDIEAEQIKYVKPVSSGWASIVGQSSQPRKVTVQKPIVNYTQQPSPSHPTPTAHHSNRQSSSHSNSSLHNSPSKKPVLESSKRSVEFVKWCKSECKRFGVPDPATNVITELAEKQLVLDSLLAMGVDPVDADHFGEEFIRRIHMDEEMVVVKRRKRRNK